MIWLVLNFTAIYAISGNLSYGFLSIPLSGNLTYQVTYVGNNTAVVISQGVIRVGNEVKNVTQVYKLNLSEPLYFFPFTTNKTLDYLGKICNLTKEGELLKVVCQRENSTQIMIVDLNKMVAKKEVLVIRGKVGTITMVMDLKKLR